MSDITPSTQTPEWIHAHQHEAPTLETATEIEAHLVTIAEPTQQELRNLLARLIPQIQADSIALAKQLADRQLSAAIALLRKKNQKPPAGEAPTA